MKISQGTLMAAALLVASFAGANKPARADVLNIPASSGMLTTDPSYNCKPLLGTFGVQGGYPSLMCQFEIPIVIPAGHTIQQIAVVHASNTNIPNPYLQAALWTTNSTSNQNNVEFPWSSSSFVLPQQTFAVSNLMPQLGKNFPAAFVVQPDTTYNVVFEVDGGSIVTGLQVTYQ